MIYSTSQIIKIGGSLFDLADLRDRLLALLSRHKNRHTILIPGGGRTADLVRTWDRMSGLGEERSHWLALRALTLNGHFLASILPGARVVATIDAACRVAAEGLVPILDMHAWALEDDSASNRLPHSWDVTSDSLAVRVALCAGAGDLILLKSVDFSGDDWQRAAALGVVDPYFPVIMSSAKSRVHVQVINLRTGRNSVERNSFRSS
jgi:5-(aminomethyl)-3-furanmethanol phosphate kinase